MTVLRKKVEFTKKHKKFLIEFAELPTPDVKLNFLESNEEFNNDFTDVYPDYKNYLIVTLQRDKLLTKVNQYIVELEYKILDVSDTKEIKNLQNRLKRASKISRKLKRKLKYRIREKNYYDNHLVNDWIDVHNRIYYKEKYFDEFISLIIDIDSDYITIFDIISSDQDLIKMTKNIYSDYWHYLRLNKIIKQRIDLRNRVYDDRLIEKIDNRITKMTEKLNAIDIDNIKSNCYREWKLQHNAGDTEVLTTLIMIQVDSVIIRQINRKHFHRFSTAMDDLCQEIRLACLTSITKFNLSKGKYGRESFNWFSLICIKAGHMITKRKSDRDNIELSNTDVVMEFLDNDTDSAITSIDSFDFLNNDWAEEKTESYAESDPLSFFYNYFQGLFDGRERMQLLLQILVYYILNISYFTFKKNEFVKYTKSYGFTPAYVNKFLGIIKSHKDKFSDDISLII